MQHLYEFVANGLQVVAIDKAYKYKRVIAKCRSNEYAEAIALALSFTQNAEENATQVFMTLGTDPEDNLGY